MSNATLNIGTEKVGTRIYVVGNSYPVKDQLKSAGCHWDSERKQWWIGAAKADKIAGIVGGLHGKQIIEPEREITVCGKAVYKGRNYYVMWAGATKQGTGPYKFRLTSLDGKIDFWADGSPNDGNSRPEGEKQAQWVKRFQEKKSLESIRRYVEDLNKAEQGGAGSRPDPDAYLRDGEWLMRGCSECSRLGRMCKSCEFDVFDN